MREHLSHNVVLNLIIAACCGLADSIWTGTIGVAFISDVWHTNKRVGIATALTGLAALASALPAGWAADRYGRAKVCRVGSLAILGRGAGVRHATLRATEGKDRELSYILICIASAFFGLSSGIINGPAQALLADSVSTGARSKVYTWLFACYIVPSVLGPAIICRLFRGARRRMAPTLTAGFNPTGHGPRDCPSPSSAAASATTRLWEVVVGRCAGPGARRGVGERPATTTATRADPRLRTPRTPRTPRTTPRHRRTINATSRGRRGPSDQDDPLRRLLHGSSGSPGQRLHDQSSSRCGSRMTCEHVAGGGAGHLLRRAAVDGAGLGLLHGFE